MKRLAVTIRSNLLLRIIYKYTRILQLFTKNTNGNYLQELLKMPSCEGLGLIEIVYVFGLKEITSHKVS